MEINQPEDQKVVIARIAELLPRLAASQLRWVEDISKQFCRDHKFERNPNSDLISDCMLMEIGDSLRMHHCFSKGPFSKDKFEFLMERATRDCGGTAELAKTGNPGDDITINGERFSLKSQANKSLSRKNVHISKFMELGKGKWEHELDDFIGLRKQFFDHMKSYDRILILRALSKEPKDWEYELVEIPKSLLEESANGEFVIMTESDHPCKSGYCHVKDDKGTVKFSLYFDGAGERKLQIKSINIDNLIVHARWTFPPNELIPENSDSDSPGLFDA